jgi:hypothetical protein
LDAVLDYVCGEAHRAYSKDRPALWVRHLLFVKAQKNGPPPYVLICDEVEAGAQPMTFAWQLHSGYPYTHQGDGVNISGRAAELFVHLLAPADGMLLDKQTPAPRADQRTHFFQWQTPGASARCAFLAALVPRTKKDKVVVPLSFRVIEAAGGWAVECTSGTAVDLVLFRSELARTVSAEGFQTTGTAALLRENAGLPNASYVLGSPGAER